VEFELETLKAMPNPETTQNEAKGCDKGEANGEATACLWQSRSEGIDRTCMA
jgi:hypothetical protein